MALIAIIYCTYRLFLATQKQQMFVVPSVLLIWQIGFCNICFCDNTGCPEAGALPAQQRLDPGRSRILPDTWLK